MADLGIYRSNAFKNASGVSQVVANANVEVRRESDGGLAAIYSDRAGSSAITQAAYPSTSGFKADADGYFEFYAAGLQDGYKIRVYSDDLTVDKTARYQPTGLARERDATSYGAQLMAAADKAAALAVLGVPSSVDTKIPVGDGTNYVAIPVPMGFALLNGYLEWTVAGNALTAAVKNWAGSDPSAADPVFVAFRDPTVSTGLPVIRKLTAATSVTASSGSTLGTVNATAFRIWCVAFNDGGTVRLGLINCLTETAPNFNIYPLGAWPIASSTAEGGAGAADSAGVFYTGTAVTSAPYSILGYATWESGLTTAGTWSAGPTRAQAFGPHVPLPGARVQTVHEITSALSTTTTQMPNDDTIPQNTEGAEVIDVSITPTSAANLLEIEGAARMAHSAAAYTLVAAIFHDSVADALASATQTLRGAGDQGAVSLEYQMRANTTSAKTFDLRGGGNTAGTLTFNGTAGGRLLGGVNNTWLRATEIMA